LGLETIKGETGPSPSRPTQDHDVPKPEEVQSQLRVILASPHFHASKRCQQFLEYVCEKSLAGKAGDLKERTVAIDVFGRQPQSELAEDTIVRVGAREVRKRLGLYYSDLGSHNPVRIELPSGTYVPEFHLVNAPPPAPAGRLQGAAPDTLPVPPPAAPRYRVLRPRHAALAVLVLIAAAVLAWLLARPRLTALDQFWAPVLNGSSPLELCAAYVPVYGVDIDPSISPPSSIQDFTLLTDQFVGGGDLIATSRLAAMLTRLHRAYRVKLGNDVSFADLRAGPAILVGFSYTKWKQISSQMRFFVDGYRRPAGITDNGKPTEWVLPALPRDRRTSEDYAIVSRVFHPDTHTMLVELAGITQYGTDAAADLVTNPDLMAEALRGAPTDWPKKNLQLVLHVKVISGTPSSPKVVKQYFW